VFWAIGNGIGHTTGCVARAFALLVIVGAVIVHALDLAEPLDLDD
jgi:hypothetical protein